MPRVLLVQSRLEDAEGVEQIVVSDGEAALAQFEREPFDAVVVDLRLPPVDGWLVLAQVARLAGVAGGARIVALTGNAADARRAARLGANVCVRGTDAAARVLQAVSKEKQKQWQPPHATTCPAPTTTGATA
jgi:CheY-like chemotaxis protein